MNHTRDCRREEMQREGHKPGPRLAQAMGNFLDFLVAHAHGGVEHGAGVLDIVLQPHQVDDATGTFHGHEQA